MLIGTASQRGANPIGMNNGVTASFRLMKRSNNIGIQKSRMISGLMLTQSSLKCLINSLFLQISGFIFRI
jgi:hypothetical protein